MQKTLDKAQCFDAAPFGKWAIRTADTEHPIDVRLLSFGPVRSKVPIGSLIVIQPLTKLLVREGWDALIAPNVTVRLLKAFAGSASAPAPRDPVEPLTDREEHVLATVARGRSNSEIASELHITLSTVKTHVTSLMQKLGARNRVEVAAWAHERNRWRGRPGD